MIRTGPMLIFLASAAAVYLVAEVIAIWEARNRRMLRPKREIVKFILFLYTVFLLELTLWPFIIAPNRFVSVNIVPMKSILGYFRNADRRVALVNFYGNIAAFVPMGLLAPAVFRRFRKLPSILLLCLLFSLGIELMQLTSSYFGLMTRNADVDDVILNTLGGLAGFGLYSLFTWFLQKCHPARSDKYTE